MNAPDGHFYDDYKVNNEFILIFLDSDPNVDVDSEGKLKY